MTGVSDLLHSERGTWSIAVLVLVTVLVLVGKLSGEQWLDFVKYLSAAIIASKTVTTAVESYATRQPQIPKATIVRNGNTAPP